MHKVVDLFTGQHWLGGVELLPSRFFHREVYVDVDIVGRQLQLFAVPRGDVIHSCYIILIAAIYR